MNVAVVGLGYVGLSMSVLLARKHKVYAVDVSSEKVEAIKVGQSPIEDPEITEELEKQTLDLWPTTDLQAAVKDAEFVIVATPTDYDAELNKFDITSVKSVIANTLKYNPAATIFIKSTIYVGCVEEIRSELNHGDIFFSPEFLREGSALQDNLYPSRIIVGGITDQCKKFANMLSECALKKECDVLLMGAREAEAVKLFANTYLAMRVGFFNELDSYCLANGLVTEEIINGVCLEPRIGEGYNNPSFGYGGYCFPKDTKQMVSNFGSVPQALMSAVVRTNNARWDFLSEEILKMNPKQVGVYRLAMKANSDNFRQSAIFEIVRRLIRKGLQVTFFEPATTEPEIAGMKACKDIDELKSRSDVILANRVSKDLEDVMEKVFTRDVFNTD